MKTVPFTDVWTTPDGLRAIYLLRPSRNSKTMLTHPLYLVAIMAAFVVVLAIIVGVLKKRSTTAPSGSDEMTETAYADWLKANSKRA